jgi:hypothetical protein
MAGAVVCTQTSAPTTETCDGLDNDCDGAIDNGNPGGGAACSTGQQGTCAAGTTACTGGAVVCARNQAPTAETCDGLDNDCDGAIDNGNPSGGVACTTGQQGVCSAGTTACTGGAVICNRTTNPTTETCDGLDNDCNGVVDNGNPGGGATCSTGNPGICAAGTTVCAAGAITCTQTQTARAETCNGLDDDCNGVVDDGNPGGGSACVTGQPGICSAGTSACTSGTIVCAGNQGPTAETCDGLDNDCDGAIDNGNPGGGVACATGQQGICSAGTTSCISGAVACNRNQSPSTETCDGIDQNCNGTIDDGAAASCAIPPHGTASCTGAVCGIASCNAGFGDCNGLTPDGCEINTSTNSNNCGTCGHVCSGGAACSGGTCALACLSLANDAVTGQKCPIKAACTTYADCGTQVNGHYWFCSPTTHVCEFLSQSSSSSGYTATAGSCTGQLQFRQDTNAPWDKRIVPPDGVSFREGTTLTFEVTNTTAAAIFLDQIPLTLETGGVNPSQFDPSNIKMYMASTSSITDFGDGNNGLSLVCSSPTTPFGSGLNFTLGTGATGGYGGSSFSRIAAGATVRFIVDLAFSASETYIANRQYRLRMNTTTGVKGRALTSTGTVTTYTACTVPTVPMIGSYLIFKTP